MKGKYEEKRIKERDTPGGGCLLKYRGENTEKICARTGQGLKTVLWQDEQHRKALEKSAKRDAFE